MSEPAREQAIQEQEIEVRGRWIGDMSDPHRRFEGVVQQCEHLELPSGCRVTVLFDAGPPMLGSDAGRAMQHGRYRLTADDGPGGFMLTTFARADAPYASGERQSGEEEVWRGRVVESAE